MEFRRDDTSGVARRSRTGERTEDRRLDLSGGFKAAKKKTPRRDEPGGALCARRATHRERRITRASCDA
ncbi:hypothetical protein PSP6_40042 [Paraburkholderia tropica]|nr:hypothetical protein PSP6_40042 [Paraburkholderia tropica]